MDYPQPESVSRLNIGDTLELLAEGSWALQVLDSAMQTSFVKQLLRKKLTTIVQQEYTRFGTVDLEIKLYRAGPGLRDDWVLKVQTKYLNGHHTDPLKTYAFICQRNHLGEITHVRH